MPSRRSFAAGALATTALAALRVNPERAREGVLSGVALGIGPLAVDELTTCPRLPVATMFGRQAVLFEGRFLGWVPPDLRVTDGDRVRVQESRLDRSGRLVVRVEVA